MPVRPSDPPAWTPFMREAFQQIEFDERLRNRWSGLDGSAGAYWIADSIRKRETGFFLIVAMVNPSRARVIAT